MHENEALIREGYDAFVRGDIDALKRFLAPDVIWHISGAGQLAGIYKGHDELVALFARLYEMTGGTISLVARDILANDENVIVLTTIKGEREGRVLDEDGVAVFKIVDGKATEVWNFTENEAALAEFFS